MLDQIAQRCLSHFLCRFDPKSGKRLTQDVVREVALEVYSEEKVNEFIDYRLAKFQATLVEEFNQRLADKRPLRFQIADDAGIGKTVAGYRQKKVAKEIRFQNSLHRISAADFEKLASIVLRVMGCQEVFSTPSSHDQGVDAFGYQTLVKPTPYGVTHGLTWIAQAKHYMSTQVTTGDVRELVGSKELLVAKVFSTVDERYKELRLRCYAPTAVALVTTEEIPTTVRRLADGAGLFVFASSDLFYLLGPSLKKKYTVTALRAFINKEAKTIRTLT
jgi:Restriction endonuclease